MSLNTAQHLTCSKLSKAMNACYVALDKAMAKHTNFPAILTRQPKEVTEIMVNSYREFEKSGSETAYTVFMEDFQEFIEAVQQGDINAATIELAQCQAVLMRIAMHLEHYVETKGGV